MRPSCTTNSATPMFFWTGTGNSLKSFFEEPSQNNGCRFSVMHYIRPDIDIHNGPCRGQPSLAERTKQKAHQSVGFFCVASLRVKVNR